MARYVKLRVEVNFNTLLHDRIKYEKYPSYSYRTPQTLYVWLVLKNEIIFFKRPNEITKDTLVLKSSVIFEDRQKAKKVARNMTPQLLWRIFKHTKTIGL